MSKSKKQVLLTKESASAKLSKYSDGQYEGVILYLAPADMVQGMNVCPAATMGCKSACLNTAGRGRFTMVQEARIKRTIFLRDHEEEFINQLVSEIDKAKKRVEKKGKRLAVRLNGTSDVDWESLIRQYHPYFYEEREDITFYEYTKRPDLAMRTGPVLYTFSRSESTPRWLLRTMLDAGVNVAVVFSQYKKGEQLPDMIAGYRVVDGDTHDYRFLDPQDGRIVALRAKGDAKGDGSGFVVSDVSELSQVISHSRAG